MVMNAYVDANHAGGSMTRRSLTGFLIYMNSALMYLHSKKQMSAERSTFTNEFMTMKHCMEYICGL